MDATVRRLLGLSLACAVLACRPTPRAGAPPADAGTVVTVYIPAQLADRLMGRLQSVAARHQWVLSVRTDSGALREADLVIVDSAGVLVGRVRPGGAVAQAQAMAGTVLP
jgi:hypothetical protein